MCGINGLLNFEPADPERNRRDIERMNEAIFHRGPDEDGVFADAFCGMGMRRLSIIDLTTGRQPIYNETGRMLIVLNGEIYNYRELRAHVLGKGHHLTTASDTEVVLHLYEEYGERAVEMLKGMFVFAIYDRDAQTLFIARDRAGEKPLYYLQEDSRFIFASELKAVTRGLGLRFPLDAGALNAYLSLSYIPAPMTIYQGVRKLEAGHWLKLQGRELTVRRYWDVRSRITDPVPDYGEAKRLVRTTMAEAVEAMMVSDVPLGAFLSGGIDSSIVTGLMSRVASGRVMTFSVGFKIPDYDETDRAKAVSAFHNTDHHSIVLDYGDALGWLDRILGNLDEPFADASCLPTYYVAQFARQHVKVALTGDGGDEMFAGYSKYLVDFYTRYYNLLPSALTDLLFEPVLARLPDRHSIIRKIKKVVRNKGLDRFTQRKNLMMLGFPDASSLLRPELARPGALDFIDHIYHGSGIEDELTRTLYTDMRVVLDGDMLTKVDRMSMLASLETRAPFLAADMMELAFRLPSAFKLRGRRQKIILKDAFSDLFPPGLLNAPKKGFGVPVGEWFKGPLKGELLEALAPARLERQGIFQPAPIARLLEEHFAERENHSHRLWTLYVFQRWMDTVA